ncbi:hypothetical protein II5_05841 [Bacillus cereus MSX-A1]|uniref:hypothetical protein n=1 Tax=Bacillus cereus TaxID=1396 RepID=UPI0002795BB6|nr:hypothetical protein II5_05841 [Bacillus cereus MSX-A1]
MIQICDNVPTNLAAPGAGQVVSTITLTRTANIIGTIVYLIKLTDIGAKPVKVFNPTPVVIPTTELHGPVQSLGYLTVYYSRNYSNRCILCIYIYYILKTINTLHIQHLL